ncbi:MAG: hypothetical protein K0S93_1822, partial [Nitrososphaeraceae archaeon]|nr:hypothetical protein [Nitrososphaeraceae archaeon]
KALEEFLNEINIDTQQQASLKNI